MDFTGRSVRVAELRNEVLDLVDNRVERVVVKATSREGFINGLYATITTTGDGVSRTYRTPLIVDSLVGVAILYVKYGISYTVEVDNYGSVQPAQKSFFADRSTRDVEFYYDCRMAPLGVWIEATDGTLIGSTDWATDGAGKTPQSVVLVTSDHQFRIGLQNAHSTTLAWGGYLTDIGTIVNIYEQYQAIEDFDFESKTTKIINALNPGYNGEAVVDGKTSGHVDENTVSTTGQNATVGAPAAEMCRHYSSGNLGAGSWSLPSLGCLYLMYLNKAAINAALTVCGGVALSNDYNWSCTEYSGYYAWSLNFTIGNPNTYYRSNSYYGRAVAAF